MSDSRPRKRYRRLESDEIVISDPVALEPRAVTNPTARLIFRVLHKGMSWRTRHMSPAKLERARREQEIALTALGHPPPKE